MIFRLSRLATQSSWSTREESRVLALRRPSQTHNQTGTSTACFPDMTARFPSYLFPSCSAQLTMAHHQMTAMGVHIISRLTLRRVCDARPRNFKTNTDFLPLILCWFGLLLLLLPNSTPRWSYSLLFVFGFLLSWLFSYLRLTDSYTYLRNLNVKMCSTSPARYTKHI